MRPRVSPRQHVNRMSRRTGRSKRLRLYDRGNTACPICLTGFTRDQASFGRTVTLEHVPIKALGGKARCLTCKTCNSKAGSGIDQAAAVRGQDRFGVTVDILGKRDTFMLSLEGKALTRPFAGYSRQDWRDLEKSGSRTFSMSIRIPDAKAVAASSLRSAYLAMFSLLGPRFGYAYVQGGTLTPIRQRIMDPLKHSAIAEYVIKAPDDVPRNDIALVKEPLACWLLKIADHLVVLPTWRRQPNQPAAEGTGEVGRGASRHAFRERVLVLFEFRDVLHRPGSPSWCRHQRFPAWPSYRWHPAKRPPIGGHLHSPRGRIRHTALFASGNLTPKRAGSADSSRWCLQWQRCAANDSGTSQ